MNEQERRHFLRWVKRHDWGSIDRDILLRHLRTYFGDIEVYQEEEEDKWTNKNARIKWLQRLPDGIKIDTTDEDKI